MDESQTTVGLTVDYSIVSSRPTMDYSGPMVNRGRAMTRCEIFCLAITVEPEIGPVSSSCIESSWSTVELTIKPHGRP